MPSIFNVICHKTKTTAIFVMFLTENWWVVCNRKV